MDSSKNLPSNKSFGVLVTVIFFAIGAYRFYRGPADAAVYGWLGAALIVGLITVFASQLLAPFNKAWFLLGELLGRLVSPLVIGAIFFLLLTPIGLVTRLFGRDELRLKQDARPSYWIDRVPPGPASDSFKNQF